MNKNERPAKELDLTPTIPVVKINPAVYWIVCGILASVGAVLFYSVQHKHQPRASIEVPHLVNPGLGDELWFKSVPNSTSRTSPLSSTLERHKKQEDNSDVLPKDSALLQQQQAELKAAMDSPIKAPINDFSSANTVANNLVAGTSDESQQIDVNTKGLTLTQQQAQRLQHLFTEKNKATDRDTLHETLKKPFSPYVLQAGGLIPATLAAGIISELPGQLTALVSQNVYDSVRGNYVLIPQGSKLILTYDANVSYGQQRLLVAVKRLIFPNGTSMNLEGMPCVDKSGYAGFHDQVDNHYIRTFGSAGMMGLITGGFQLSQPQQGSILNTQSPQQIMGSAMGQQMGQVGMNMINKNLDVAPTLNIRPGYEFNVQVTSDMVFPGSYQS